MDTGIRDIPRRISAHLVQFRRDTPDTYSVLWLVDNLAQPGESRVRFDPAILIRGLRLVILELAQLVVYVVRVTTFDARLPAAKPLFVLLLRVLVVFPEKEIRLRLLGRPEDICI